MHLKNNASMDDIINWSLAVATPSCVDTIIAPIPEGYDDWAGGVVVRAPITRDDAGKIIWTDELLDWVNELNGPGWAIHPKEDLID